jgi:hypothetical protein
MGKLITTQSWGGGEVAGCPEKEVRTSICWIYSLPHGLTHLQKMKLPFPRTREKNSGH